MADILNPDPTPGTGEGPIEPSDPFTPPEQTLVSEQMKGQVGGGSTFEERALQLQQPSGPHIMAGGKIDKLVGTAGRMNQLMHGATGPDYTSGQAQRAQLIGARDARSDPRDALHYREDFGTTMTDPTHRQAVQHQTDFYQYVDDTNKQLAEYSQQIEQDKVTLETEYAKGLEQIESSYQAALGTLPPTQTLDGAYNTWLDTSNHGIWIYSGSNPDNPGEEEAKYKLTPEQTSQYFDYLVNDLGVPVHANKVYVGGRGQEIHDELRTYMQQNKVEFYESMGPEVAKANQQIDALKTEYATQKATATNELQTAYSDQSSQIAAAEGAVQGRQEGLTLEVQANKEDLADIRNSYTERVTKIDEALQMMLGGNVQSQSEAYQPKQLSPLMPGAQQQQQG